MPMRIFFRLFYLILTVVFKASLLQVNEVDRCSRNHAYPVRPYRLFSNRAVIPIYLTAFLILLFFRESI